MFFCGLDPKSYYAVTKVLDGFCFSILQTMGPSGRRVGFCFVPCFASGILVGEFKTYRIIMYSSGTMNIEGSQAARKPNIVKLLRGVRGSVEKMRFAKHRFTVQTIVTAL